MPCLILAAPVVRMVLNGGCFGFESYAMLLGVMNAAWRRRDFRRRWPPGPEVPGALVPRCC